MKNLCVAAVVMRSGFGEIESNLGRMEVFVKEAARQGADIVCFPEMCVTGYALKEEIRSMAEPVPGPSTWKVQHMAAENDIIILAGLAERLEGESIAITQIVVSPGREIERYRKLHLSAGEQALFQAGTTTPVFKAGETDFGLQLCYDAHFPELSTMLALNGAEVVFMPHASPAPETADEKRNRWLRYLSARAYDNSVFVVACNQVGDGGAGISFSGVALVLDPRGEIIAESAGDEDKMIVAELKADLLAKTRNTRMGFFLSHRRPELYGELADGMTDAAFRHSPEQGSAPEEELPSCSRDVRAVSNV